MSFERAIDVGPLGARGPAEALPASKIREVGNAGMGLEDVDRPIALVKQVAEGCEKREQYGYWDARLRDGFHFEPIRRIAKRRLEHTRQVCKLLGEELEEDKP